MESWQKGLVSSKQDSASKDNIHCIVFRYYTTPTKEDGSRALKAESKSILPLGQKELFAKKALLCVEYKDLTPQQEIELFQRVQLGKPLTKAEVFRASQGKWQDLARVFEKDYAEVINRR